MAASFAFQLWLKLVAAFRASDHNTNYIPAGIYINGVICVALNSIRRKTAKNNKLLKPPSF
jgi:hypothetical protein